MSNRFIDQYVKDQKILLANDWELRDRIRTWTRTNAPVELSMLPENEVKAQIAVSLHSESANVVDSSYLHTHQCFELIYVYEGSCHQIFSNHSMVMDQGSLCLLNTCIRHGICTDSDSDVVFNILIDKDLLSKAVYYLFADNEVLNEFFTQSLYLQNPTEQYIFFNPAGSSEAEVIIQRLIAEYLNHKPGFNSALQAYLTLLFNELFRNYTYQFETLSGKDMLFTKILAYINDNIDTVTLPELSQHFHYHPNYLSALFRQHMQKTFTTVVNDLRFQRIADYLTNTDISINEIVEIMNFYDRSYFNREFKKRYGINPKEYRDRSRGVSQ